MEKGELKMEKCGAKCEVYSRVTGYFRPIANWNKGKQEEFKDRKVYKIGKAVAILAGLLVLALAAGCSTAQTLAKGLSEKSISGSGTVSIQRVGIDDETKTPVLKSTVVTGDYASAHNGDYALQYRRKKSPSIFNKDAVTEEVTINYIGTKEYATAALDLAKQDATAATEQSGLEKPAAATPATDTVTPSTSEQTE